MPFNVQGQDGGRHSQKESTVPIFPHSQPGFLPPGQREVASRRCLLRTGVIPAASCSLYHSALSRTPLRSSIPRPRVSLVCLVVSTGGPHDPPFTSPGLLRPPVAGIRYQYGR